MSDTAEAVSTLPLLMTLPEVVAYLRVSERWVYQQVRDGALPAIMVARTYRFRPQDVEDFLDGLRVNGGLGVGSS